MKTRLRIFLIATVLAWARGAPAQVVTLNYGAANTGVDNGPQDGIFDAFVPLNLGSVTDNGYTSFRTAIEFQLPPVPPGSKIRSAVVNGTVNSFEGNRRVALYGYAGDGTIPLADFALGTELASSAVGLVGANPFALDVTSFFSASAGNGQPFVGFNLREEPPNSSNFMVMSLAMGIPSP